MKKMVCHHTTHVNEDYFILFLNHFIRGWYEMKKMVCHHTTHVNEDYFILFLNHFIPNMVWIFRMFFPGGQWRGRVPAASCTCCFFRVMKQHLQLVALSFYYLLVDLNVALPRSIRLQSWSELATKCIVAWSQYVNLQLPPCEHACVPVWAASTRECVPVRARCVLPICRSYTPKS
jgi:hypothetical protein